MIQLSDIPFPCSVGRQSGNAESTFVCKAAVSVFLQENNSTQPFLILELRYFHSHPPLPPSLPPHLLPTSLALRSARLASIIIISAHTRRAQLLVARAGEPFWHESHSGTLQTFAHPFTFPIHVSHSHSHSHPIHVHIDFTRVIDNTRVLVLTCDCLSMDTALKALLASANISEETCSVLEDEGIILLEAFSSLREEHFERLLPKLKVGQHALLMRLWDREQNVWRNANTVS